ncbi:endo-1,4-beta-xylanase [Hyphomonas sp.]|uniref:endo-1,4-beta-xylanase n=1 Tax=Hyphomonas sp. TaxID=87 RepID=UPI0030F4E77E
MMLAYPELKEVLIWGMVDDQSWLQIFLPRADDVLKRPTLYNKDYKAKAMRSSLADPFWGGSSPAGALMLGDCLSQAGSVASYLCTYREKNLANIVFG